MGVLRFSSNPGFYGLNSTSETSEIIGVNAADASGKLRLVRTGTTVWGYYHDGTQFVLIASSPTDLNPTRFFVDFGGAGSSGQVVIAIDNFKLTADTITC